MPDARARTRLAGLGVLVLAGSVGPATPAARSAFAAPAPAAPAAPAPGARAASDESLLRDAKIAQYDGDWDTVLRSSDSLLRRYPASPLAPQAEFHRARALAHMPGREAEAAEAFRGFIRQHPRDRDRLLVDQAWSGLFSLACEGKRRASPACSATLGEGIADPSLYVSTLAAIRAADAGDPAVRRSAVPILKRAYDLENDTEIRNEILIALLKIDPRQVPPPPPAPPAPPRAAAQDPAVPPLPSLVKMTIYNKASKTYDLKINLPVAFAQILVDALGKEERSALKDSAAAKGVDLDDIFKAIRKNGQGRLLDMDAPDSRIEVWIE
ncbi:MAG TPA: hypothetical protein VFQ07_04580 [Candidatus Polarisedimenticolia bacterium]|nr:hypothetical protein [Candidatus Polarisedimenticolia bacterium]